ncbi:hypothetical protein F511_35348 [Dorcoceras hygrometricum]|uniref:CCHC-type domain-containing protein n=1 Tax=Dorcoceras hygrometricum TaxID=472368 RepID=A0A2Z7CFM1_9LAMI|nr:hypothetical protein F511_35348 [Dorcoceras hygrometricum]
MREIKRHRIGVSNQSLAKSASSNAYVDSAESARELQNDDVLLVETLRFECCVVRGNQSLVLGDQLMADTMTWISSPAFTRVFKEDLVFYFKQQIPYLAKYYPDFRPLFFEPYKPKTYAEAVDSAIDIEEGLRSRRARRQQVAHGGRPTGEGAQSSQSSQSVHQPQQQQQPLVAQQSGRQRFRPCGQQFKKKSGSGSSGSGNSSSSGSGADFCGFCGGKHPSTQCVGVQGSCNLCGQYGYFARVCPSAGSQQTAAQLQGLGDCGSLRQSGPRPDPRLLRQTALEALTRSARTNTPRKTRPEQFPAKIVGGGGDVS